MANQEHLDILRQGVDVWNKWRQEYTDIQPDLYEAILISADLSRAKLVRAILNESNLSKATLTKADLSGAYLFRAGLSEADLSEADLSKATLTGAHLFRATLTGADLSGAYLSEAYLSDATLTGADLSGATLTKANLIGATLTGANLSKARLGETFLIGATLTGADLSGADLREADLSRAKLVRANLSGADLSGADLIGADLSRARLIDTNFTEATLTDCNIYGISAWKVQLQGATQNNLVITPEEEPTITVDNLKVAQFIYLLLNNEEIRDVINTLTTKSALILGRFTPERKAVLEALREALRTYGYLPILFDFDKPSSRNFTETVRTLAHLSCFIIADLTDPSSIPQELQAIVPTLAIPVQPVLLEGKREYAMFVDLLSTYPWMLPIHYYKDQANLLATLKEYVIKPAEQKAKELEKR